MGRISFGRAFSKSLGSFSRRNGYHRSNPILNMIGSAFMGIVLIFGGIITLGMEVDFWLSFGLIAAGAVFIGLVVLVIVLNVRKDKQGPVPDQNPSQGA